MADQLHNGNQTNVLIIDDDPDIGQALGDLLEHEGYCVHLAMNGKQAIERVAQQHYGAVILDLGLPDVDGLDLLKSLVEADSKLPVIVLTAYTTTDKTVGALSQGAFAFLTKPYNRDQLKATLNRAIGVKALATRAETVESALTASEERFRSVVQSSHDGIIIASGQGDIMSWNKAAQQLFGYTEEEVLGKPLTLIMPERYREVYELDLRRYHATGQSKMIGRALEMEGLRKGGTEFPVELSIASWTRTNEAYYCAIVRDVTERKRTQAALQASEERFRSLVADIPGAVYRCACNPRWTMEFLSEGIEDLCGYPAADFLADRVRSYASIIHPEDRAIVEHMIFGAVEGKRPYALEYRLLHADGSVRWVYGRGQGIFDGRGRVRWLDGALFDLTDRRRAEEALQASEERYRALYEDNPSMYFMVDADGTVLSVNPFGAEQLGYQVAELVGRPVLTVFHEADREAVRRNLDDALRQMNRTMKWEFRKVRKDGTLLWVRETARAVHSTTKDPVVLIVCEDITEQKQAEEALRAVVEGTAALVGQEFFHSLVCHLASALQVKYALAAMCVDSPATKVRTLAVWSGDGFADNFEYALRGTPCADVIEGELRYYPRDVQRLFPDDEAAVRLGVESYLGVALLNSGGAVIGHLAVMDEKPMDSGERQNAILKIFAARAGAELERMQAESALRMSEERLDLAVRGSADGLWDARPLDGVPWESPETPVWYSPRFKAMLGFEEREFPDVLESWLARLHPDDKERVFAALTLHIEGKAPYDVEYRLATKQQEWRWFRARGQAIWNERGGLLRIAGSLQCITDRKRAEAALHEQLRLSRFLAELGIVLTRSRTLRDLLGLCAETLVHHLNAACVRIWILNQEGTALKLQASAGLDSCTDDLARNVPIDSEGIGRIARTHRPYVTSDLGNDPSIGPGEWAVREGLSSFAGYPLMVEDRAIGVVGVYGRSAPTDYAIGALASAANGIAVGVERKQAEEALQHKFQVEKVIAGISAWFVSVSDFDQAVSASLADMGRVSGASRAYLFLFREGGAVMDNTHEWCADGVSSEIDGLQNLPSADFPWGMEKLRAGGTIQIEDVSRLPREASAERAILEKQQIKSLLIIPVFVDQELAGFVGFDNVVSTGRWRDEDLFLLRIAAEIIGTAIQRTRAAETLMRLSHQRELILNSAGEGIYGLDPEGRTTFLNPTAARLLGWEAAELFGRSMHEAVHHSKADGSPYPPEECPIYAALKDGSVHTVANEVFWKKDGTPFPVDYVSTPIHEHGLVVGAVVVFKDITERKVAEDALRESEQLFRQVTESIKEVFWMSDPHKNAVLYVSPGYETVWGRSCESLHVAPRSWLDAIHPDDRDRVLQAALTKQVTGEYDEEYRIIRPDGTVRWIHDRAFPVKDTSGSVYRIAGLAEDVTEQRERGRGNRSAPPPENR